MPITNPSLGTQVGSFIISTGDMGLKAITGIGFQPKSVIIKTGRVGVAGGMSDGMGDPVNQVAHTHDAALAAAVGKIIQYADSLGKAAIADLASLDPDGFTINITSNNLVGGDTLPCIFTVMG